MALNGFRSIYWRSTLPSLFITLLLFANRGECSPEQLPLPPQPGTQEELVRCNFLPGPPDRGPAEMEAMLRAVRDASRQSISSLEEPCGVEESLTNSGAVIIRFKSLVCGSVCAVSREEEWREMHISRPNSRRVYMKRSEDHLYGCFEPSYLPAAGPFANDAPAYPVRITTRIFHDSSAWLCCNGEQFATAQGSVHQIVDQTYDLNWCVNRIDGENGDDQGAVQLASTESSRQSLRCLQPDGSYGVCDDWDTATCDGDITLAPAVCLPEETPRGDRCDLESSVLTCNDLLENGDDPSVYDDDERATLHVFAFDGYQNPGVNQNWAETIGSSRPVNPEVRIDWHLFTQDRIASAAERLVNLSRLYPEDYFATAGFSWGGHSAIKLAKRVRRRGVSLELGFSCDPVPHALVLPMHKPGNVGVWWNVFQQAGTPSGRPIADADAQEEVTSRYSSYLEPHMMLGRNCDDGGQESHLTLQQLIDSFLAGL